jgi:hypothetical protein
MPHPIEMILPRGARVAGDLADDEGRGRSLVVSTLEPGGWYLRNSNGLLLVAVLGPSSAAACSRMWPLSRRCSGAPQWSAG